MQTSDVHCTRLGCGVRCVTIPAAAEYPAPGAAIPSDDKPTAFPRRALDTVLEVLHEGLDVQ